VTDLKMPGMDGIGLLRALGELPQTPPVILMTAYGTIEYAVEAFRLGLFDFLQKPVSLDELSRTVERALEACTARVERASPPIPLSSFRECSRRVGPVRAEVAGDPSAADATAVWQLRALDRTRTAFVWAHVVPESRCALGARLIIRTLAGAVDLSAPAEALETMVGLLNELDCTAMVRALAVGVIESRPQCRIYGTARGNAGIFRLVAGDTGVEPLAAGPWESACTWETRLAQEDVLLFADPRVVSAAGERWPEVLFATGRLITGGEPNPARRILGMVPEAADAAPVMVALQVNETIESKEMAHVRVSSSWACLGHVRDVTEQFVLASPLDEHAAYEWITAVHEAVLNAIRWAYPGRKGSISLTLERSMGRVRASISDSGVGFDVGDTFRRTTEPSRDPLRSSGRGLMLMRRLSDEFELSSKSGCGTSIVVGKIIQAPVGDGARQGEPERG